MSDERRYTSPEIEQIFETAAKERGTLTEGSARDGLTLSELQAIGEEVGLPPQRVAEAAALLDRQEPARHRLTVAGAPIGVRMSFELPRSPTEREWGMLVGELRRTFGAAGRISSAGELREWRNGKLYATIEPTEGGYELRLGTKKSEIPGSMVGGSMMILLALGMFRDGAEVGSILLVFVALLLLGPLFRLPRWANLREAQMEHIGQWTTDLLSAGAETDPPAD